MADIPLTPATAAELASAAELSAAFADALNAYFASSGFRLRIDSIALAMLFSQLSSGANRLAGKRTDQVFEVGDLGSRLAAAMLGDLMSSSSAAPIQYGAESSRIELYLSQTSVKQSAAKWIANICPRPAL